MVSAASSLPSDEGSGLKIGLHIGVSQCAAGLPSDEGSGLKNIRQGRWVNEAHVFPRMREVD